MSPSTAPLPYPRSATPPHATNSLPTRNPPNLSPNTRDRHLKKILETHRADRQRIQHRHDDATGDLTDKLRRALSEVRRIEREFQSFQKGANTRLASILAENDRLRHRIAQLEADQKTRNTTTNPTTRPTSYDKENRAPLRDTHTNIMHPNIQSTISAKHGDRKTVALARNNSSPTDIKSQVDTKPHIDAKPRTDTKPQADTKPHKDERPPEKEAIKPSERELEVERLREAARESRRMRVPRRPSLRVLRREDTGFRRAQADERRTLNSSRSTEKSRDNEERRSVRLARSLSRKWSTCF